jgi:Streptomyces sporulation and cell division protein, SsgA
VHFESPSTLPVVECRVAVERFDETGSLVQSDALFSYDPADPFAVTLVLNAFPRDVRWTFARDLLIDGRFEPAGAGDVVVFPFLDPESGSAMTVLELRSPGGQFMSQMPQQALQSFVRAMLDTVPLGAESDLIDLDRLVDLLVAPQE